MKQLDRTTIQTVHGCVNNLSPNEDGFTIRYNQPITVRITGDKYGMTLSLADESGSGVQLVIPLEPIRHRLVDVIRKWGK